MGYGGLTGKFLFCGYNTNNPIMINEELENLINATLIDNELSPKEKEILIKKAQSLGVSPEELERYLNEKMKNSGAANTSSKRGSVKHCPNCGTIMNSFQVQCPKCGYMVDDAEANKSVKELSEAIRNAKTLDERKLVVKTFPVPNTKATLLELLTFLKPKAEDRNDPCYEAYYQKYQECIEKSKVSFGNDVDFRTFFNDQNSLKKEKKSYNRASWAKSNYKKLLIALGLAVGVIAIAVVVHKRNAKDQEIKTAETQRIAEQNRLKQKEIRQDSLLTVAINNDLEDDDYAKVARRLRNEKVLTKKITKEYIRVIKKAYYENNDNAVKELILDYLEKGGSFADISFEYIKTLKNYLEKADYESAEEMFYKYPNEDDEIKDCYIKTVSGLLRNEETVPVAEKLYLEWREDPQLFYQHFLESGDYTKAEEYFFANKERTFENHFKYLTDCVTDMCEKGQFDAAENFITANVTQYKKVTLFSKELSQREATKKLMTIVKEKKKSQKKGLFGRKKDKKK